MGNGNVSLDVARILLSPNEELSKTDINPLFLEQHKLSNIKYVDIVGRRGPVQAAFSTKYAGFINWIVSYIQRTERFHKDGGRTSSNTGRGIGD